MRSLHTRFGMHWSVRIVAVGVVWAGLASAESYGPSPQAVAPAPGRTVPQNAPAFIGGNDPECSFVEGGSALSRRELDGGVETLNRIDAGTYYCVALFEPGSLVVGERFFLGDGGVPVEVTEPAPIPTTTGTLAFGPEQWDGSSASREVYLRLSPEAEPWRAVSRVDVSARVYSPETGEQTILGRFPATFGLGDDTELGVHLGRISHDCAKAGGRRSLPIGARLEVAGGPRVESTGTTLIIDCADQPAGCSTAPVTLLAALSLLLRRRWKLRE